MLYNDATLLTTRWFMLVRGIVAGRRQMCVRRVTCRDRRPSVAHCGSHSQRSHLSHGQCYACRCHVAIRTGVTAAAAAASKQRIQCVQRTKTPTHVFCYISVGNV